MLVAATSQARLQLLHTKPFQTTSIVYKLHCFCSFLCSVICTYMFIWEYIIWNLTSSSLLQSWERVAHRPSVPTESVRPLDNLMISPPLWIHLMAIIEKEVTYFFLGRSFAARRQLQHTGGWILLKYQNRMFDPQNLMHFHILTLNWCPAIRLLSGDHYHSE